MDEDIDIEEHDVLDDPRMRNIFPDIDMVKMQVEGCQDEDTTLEDNEQYLSVFDPELKIKTEPIESPILRELLAASPCSISELYQNKIIIGTKPSVDDVDEAPVIHYDSFVLLEDWGPKLDSSPCYCKDCQILFDTRNTLDAHNMSAHSLLVAVPQNKALKSTAKPSNKIVVGGNSGLNKFCNHCNVVFPDDTSLISHLYELLPSKPEPLPCEDCDMKFENDDDLKAHTLVHNDTSRMYHKCRICFCYFRTTGSYVSHMLRNHKIKSEERDYVVFDPLCPHCQRSNFTSHEAYNSHIHKTHKSIYIKNANQKMLEMKKDNAVDGVKAKCLICKKVFLSYSSFRRHRKREHPEYKNYRIHAKVTSKVFLRTLKVMRKSEKSIGGPEKNIIQTQQDNIKHQFLSSHLPVPKSVLFKCNKCPTHYTRCLVAIFHAKQCQTTTHCTPCKKCTRSFKANDLGLHELQHKATETFKVYVVRDDLYSRILCKCAGCGVCFAERNYRVHFESCSKGDVTSLHCDECDLAIDNVLYPRHKRGHTSNNFTREDYIVVDYFPCRKKILNNMNATNQSKVPGTLNASSQLKRKLDDQSENLIMKNPKLGHKKPVMYYCQICKTFLGFLNAKSERFHNTGNCLNLEKRTCKKCGLVFSKNLAANHEYMHMKNLKLQDIVFYTLDTKEIIRPPPPEYYMCTKCGANFCSKLASLRMHECSGDIYKTCSICDIKFSDLAYKLHMAFHNYVLHDEIRRPPESLGLPEILKKYDSLPSVWNILYLCQTCDIVSDSYDKVVAHSQNHFANMESYGITIKHCQICDLNFGEFDFHRHQQIHSQNDKINRSSFRILIYDFSSLLSDKWFDLFIDIPETQSRQILNRSIYGHVRNVRLKIIRNPDANFLLYLCAKCKRYVHPKVLYFHIWHPNVCSIKHLAYKCNICNIFFTSSTAQEQHIKIHEQIETDTTSFKVMLFNSKQDQTINHALKTATVTSEPKLNEPKQKIPKAVFVAKKGPADVKFELYTCQKCNQTILNKNNIRQHKCLRKKSFLQQCPICKLYFRRHTLVNSHRQLHAKNHKFNIRNFKIIPFNNSKSVPHESKEIVVSKKEDVKVVYLYKCQCGLHFTTKAAVDKHFKECGKTRISKEKCGQCGRLFPTDSLVSHLCSHHSSRCKIVVQQLSPPREPEMLEETKLKINKSDKCIFKCSVCNVHLLTWRTLCGHYQRNHECANSFVNCKLCRLSFTKWSIKKHISYHHTKLNYKLKDFKIITVDDVFKNDINAAKLETKTSNHSDIEEQNDVTNNSRLIIENAKNILYQCERCSVYFMDQFKAKIHVKQSYHSTPKYKCSFCGLFFTKKCMLQHELVHHNSMKLQFNDFNIIILNKQNINNLPIANTDYGESSNPQLDHQLDNLNVIPEGSIYGKDEISQHDDHNTITDDEKDLVSESTAKIDEKQTPVPKVEMSKYDNVLYKCDICSLHFLMSSTLLKHKGKCFNYQKKVRCSVCKIDFSVPSLKRHMYIHHEVMKLEPADIRIMTEVDIVKAKKDDSVTDVNDTNDDSNDLSDTEDVKEEVDMNTPGTSNKSISGASQDSDAKSKIKLYKCSECNVFFLTQSTCYKHVVKHTPLDPMEYIECKVCGLQFKYVPLGFHVAKHHSTPFNPEDVLVEEYHPSMSSTPKIDIYHLGDKVQSRLVSTTTDVDVAVELVDSKQDVNSICDETVDSKSTENRIVDTREIVDCNNKDCVEDKVIELTK